MKNLLLLFFVLYFTQLMAQERGENNVIKINNTSELEAFEGTLERLIVSPYFIESVDKNSRLIQCKYLLKDKRIISRKIGDIIHYNILFRNTNDGSTFIYIQANRTEKSRSGGVDVSDHYNDDLGITVDKKYIDSLVQFIIKGFE
ncbi:hypothetical protein ACFRAE_08710 [Sphingobacterium sp. HJSM2_6]|uniref:hypothetical protein n=1 Tax=Sphingobacterium sp. HJSM2_6 TaxID=3366264 RepID=UPI003BC3384F